MKNIKQRIIDDIIWSPTDSEIRKMYPPEEHSRMIEFYRKIQEGRMKILREMNEDN